MGIADLLVNLGGKSPNAECAGWVPVTRETGGSRLARQPRPLEGFPSCLVSEAKFSSFLRNCDNRRCVFNDALVLPIPGGSAQPGHRDWDAPEGCWFGDGFTSGTAVGV